MKNRFPVLSIMVAVIMICQPGLIAQQNETKPATDVKAAKTLVPVIINGEAQKIPAFENPDDWIRQDLWVETEFDSDGDGKPDRMHVDVTRPKQRDLSFRLFMSRAHILPEQVPQTNNISGMYIRSLIPFLFSIIFLLRYRGAASVLLYHLHRQEHGSHMDLLLYTPLLPEPDFPRAVPL
jgi:hypothetical protein